jgi:hypothetical protein
MFPTGFSINTVNRQYLITSELYQLFHLISRISIDCDENENEIPIKNDEDYRVVDYPDELFNLLLIMDFVEVVDLIKEMEIYTDQLKSG